MTEVLFYHLEHKPLEIVLPELLEKCYERNWRVYVQCKNKALAQNIDKNLWSYKVDSFLPHGLDDAPKAMRKNFEAEEFAALQPILIGTKPNNPNNSSIRFLLEGCDIAVEELPNYKRIIIMFDGLNEDNVTQARKQWKAFNAIKDLSSITYWQQDEMGKWQKKA